MESDDAGVFIEVHQIFTVMHVIPFSGGSASMDAARASDRRTARLFYAFAGWRHRAASADRGAGCFKHRQRSPSGAGESLVGCKNCMVHCTIRLIWP